MPLPYIRIWSNFVLQYYIQPMDVTMISAYVKAQDSFFISTIIFHFMFKLYKRANVKYQC